MSDYLRYNIVTCVFIILGRISRSWTSYLWKDGLISPFVYFFFDFPGQQRVLFPDVSEERAELTVSDAIQSGLNDFQKKYMFEVWQLHSASLNFT